MIKILLVDDHKIIRDGIKALIQSEPNIQIIGECGDGKEVVPFLENNEVDVILMDVNMPIMNGIETTIVVSEKFPDVAVLALTMHDEEVYISKVLKAGALGYVLKHLGKAELMKAIEKVANKENYFSDDVAAIMMSKYMKSGSTSNNPPLKKVSTSLISIDELTKREVEILSLISEEMTNNEIGEKLFISPRTVDTHRRNLLQKLGVKNTAGLVKFAVQNNLVQ